VLPQHWKISEGLNYRTKVFGPDISDLQMEVTVLDYSLSTVIFRIFAGAALVLGHNSERIHCKDGKGLLIQLLQLGPRATDSTIMYYNNMQGPLVYNL